MQRQHKYWIYEWHRGASPATGVMGCRHSSALLMNLFSSGTVWRVSFVTQFISIANQMFAADQRRKAACLGFPGHCIYEHSFNRQLGIDTFDRVVSEALRRYAPPGTAFGLDVPEAGCLDLRGSQLHNDVDGIPWHLSADSQVRFGVVGDYPSFCEAIRKWGDRKAGCLQPLTVHH